MKKQKRVHFIPLLKQQTINGSCQEKTFCRRIKNEKLSGTITPGEVTCKSCIKKMVKKSLFFPAQ